MTNYIEKYFNTVLGNIERHLNSSEISAEEKEKMKTRIELINELRPNIEWQFKTSESKQVSRIQHLAMLRRMDELPHLIKKQEKAINIYEESKRAMPYLEAVNLTLNKPLTEFLNDLCDKIDIKGYSYTGNFPTITETQEAFKTYFEIIKPAQGNGNMFKECYEKIESLYSELMKLNETD
ncbi:hypothetical protein [Flavobacterium frigoris]|uniref:Uncharacterized protein n=1 Tax=Flavobacterium frigoris TaxID=229204 RepID=A0A1H9S5W5_FLAFI|nr:hypothetical protein [Flavobacterium frigoris]SER79733.1 hypothetical protein SAMN05444355_1422 [Flavobacterium frigoris]